MSKSEKSADWIAVDWGTSNLRATAVVGEEEVMTRAESDQGMAKLAAGERDFESALLEVIGPWLTTGETMPVIACGMIGARQGWIEVPYDTAPCKPRTSLSPVPTRSDEIALSIFAGVKQDSPPDVMRGEETQISGLLTMLPEYTGLVCLPGTHSKWVRVEAGEIQSFTTFLTGELFSILSKHSILRHTISKDGLDENSYLDAVHSTLAKPETFSARLFSLRAEALLENLGEITARSRLAGILAGLELAGLGKFEKSCPIALVGSPEIVHLYELALKSLNRDTTIYEVEKLTLAGLSRAIQN